MLCIRVSLCVLQFWYRRLLLRDLDLLKTVEASTGVMAGQVPGADQDGANEPPKRKGRWANRVTEDGTCRVHTHTPTHTHSHTMLPCLSLACMYVFACLPTFFHFLFPGPLCVKQTESTTYTQNMHACTRTSTQCAPILLCILLWWLAHARMCVCVCVHRPASDHRHLTLEQDDEPTHAGRGDMRAKALLPVHTRHTSHLDLVRTPSIHMCMCVFVPCSQLRKVCNHPYLFNIDAEPDFDGSTGEDIVESSGKMMVSGCVCVSEAHACV